MTAKHKPDPKDLLAQVPMSEKALAGMTLTSDDLQFLLRLQDLRDEVIKDELKEFLNDYFARDNKRLVAEITRNVTEEVAETISPIWRMLEELANGQIGIQKAVAALAIKFDDHEKRIKALESKI